MNGSWKEVYVFISSTFNDMHAERDFLVKSVFPELSEWCEEHKLRLVDIDLRWGVTAADSEAKNTVKACLRNIDECRPFFLCFLGQRRGWAPAKGDIGEDTYGIFPKLLEENYAGAASVTEMEIIHALIDPLHNGVLRGTRDDARSGEAAEHAFFFLRDPEYVKSVPHPDLLAVYTNDAEDDVAATDAELTRWREREIPRTGRPVYTYTADWQAGESTPEIALPLFVPTTAAKGSKTWENVFSGWKKRWASAGVFVDDSGAVTGSELEKAKAYNRAFTAGRLGDFRVGDDPLADIVIAQLKEAIAARYPEHMDAMEQTPLQTELAQQEQFLLASAEGFIERGDDFRDIYSYIESDETRPLAIAAESGRGKTSLLATFIREFPDERYGVGEPLLHGDVFYRFIGGSDESSTVPQLIRSLLSELFEKYGIHRELPVDPSALADAFADCLEDLDGGGGIILVLDSLDQLETGMDDLEWLPPRLPRNIKLIVSFRLGNPSSDSYYAAIQANGRMVLSGVRPFDRPGDKRALIETYLNRYFKELDEERIDALIGIQGTNNPLFLKVVLSELRLFGVHNDLSAVIRERFGNTPAEAFDALLGRMESDPAYTKTDPAVALPHLFGWLAHSRYGLSPEELSLLLLRQGIAKCTKDASDSVYTLLRQLRPFLARQEGRVNFLFESFRGAVAGRYTGLHAHAKSPEGWHGDLASFFEGLPPGNIRRLLELPWQLWKCKAGERLRTLLADADFIMKKSEAAPFDLLDDYGRSGVLHPVKERVQSLIPLLRDYPSLSVQTVYNGLNPLGEVNGLNSLREEALRGDGAELQCLGGDCYGGTGRIVLERGGFLAISDDCGKIAAIEGNRILLYDARTFRLLRSFGAIVPGEEVMRGAVSESGDVALMDMSGRIYVKDIQASGDKRRLLYSDAGNSVIFSADGDGGLFALNAATGERQRLSDAPPECVAVKKGRLAFAAEDTIHLFDYSDGSWERAASFPAAETGVRAIAVSEDTDVVLTLTLNRCLLRQDCLTGAEI
jgi:hypothetical protein